MSYLNYFYIGHCIIHFTLHYGATVKEHGSFAVAFYMTFYIVSNFFLK